jgi:hypothetical protein
MSQKKDYLAIILVGAGSSYARGPDRDDCIARVSRMVVADWSSLYDVAGKEATVNVFDVTGHESVWWDSRGVHTADDPADDAELTNEQVVVTLPAKRRAA